MGREVCGGGGGGGGGGAERYPKVKMNSSTS